MLPLVGIVIELCRAAGFDPELSAYVLPVVGTNVEVSVVVLLVVGIGVNSDMFVSTMVDFAIELCVDVFPLVELVWKALVYALKRDDLVEFGVLLMDDIVVKLCV